MSAERQGGRVGVVIKTSRVGQPDVAYARKRGASGEEHKRVCAGAVGSAINSRCESGDLNMESVVGEGRRTKRTRAFSRTRRLEIYLRASEPLLTQLRTMLPGGIAVHLQAQRGLTGEEKRIKAACLVGQAATNHSPIALQLRRVPTMKSNHDAHCWEPCSCWK